VIPVRAVSAVSAVRAVSSVRAVSAVVAVLVVFAVPRIRPPDVVHAALPAVVGGPSPTVHYV
jgi:hypothetical protein